MKRKKNSNELNEKLVKPIAVLENACYLHKTYSCSGK